MKRRETKDLTILIRKSADPLSPCNLVRIHWKFKRFVIEVQKAANWDVFIYFPGKQWMLSWYCSRRISEIITNFKDKFSSVVTGNVWPNRCRVVPLFKPSSQTSHNSMKTRVEKQMILYFTGSGQKCSNQYLWQQIFHGLIRLQKCGCKIIYCFIQFHEV